MSKSSPKITAYLKTFCGWSEGVRAIMREEHHPEDAVDGFGDHQDQPHRRCSQQEHATPGKTAFRLYYHNRGGAHVLQAVLHAPASGDFSGGRTTSTEQ